MAFTPAPTAGHDSVTGAAASGALDLLDGNDSLQATITGAVTIIGNLGEDDIEVTGDAGILIYGNADGDDINVTTDGTATIFGGSAIVDPGDGDDRITGRGEGVFLIYGNGQDDDIDLFLHDEGSDTVFGGNGNDSIFYERDGNDDSEALIFGGEQEDSIVIHTSGSVTVFGGVTTVDPADGDDQIDIDSDNGVNEVLVYGNGGEDDIQVHVSGDVTIYAGSGEDTVDGTTDGSMLIYGGEGDDRLNADTDGVGNVTVFGGVTTVDPNDGDDNIEVTSDGDVLIYGNGGNDTLRADNSNGGGIGGNITMYGGQGEDSLVASAQGDGLIYGGEGSDSLDASGIDSFEQGFDGSVTVYGGVGPFDPGDGNDSLLADADGQLLLYGNGGDDVIGVSASGNMTAYGGAGDDTIRADGQANGLIYGGEGNDTIDAQGDEGFGADVTIYGGIGPVDPNDGDDSIDAEFSGDGLIYGNGGDDTIFVRPEGDETDGSVYGGTGNDSVLYEDDSEGDNLIVMGLGNDSVDYSGLGSVTVFGGDAVFNPNDDADLIHVGEFFFEVNGGGIVDALIYGNGGDDFIQVVLATTGTVASATVYGGAADDYIEVFDDDVFTGGSDATVLVYGNEGFDTIRLFTSGDATVYGGSGGADPNDGEDQITIIGSGAYLVYGNGDDDFISIFGDSRAGPAGGQSTSTVYGGAGDDFAVVFNETSDGPVLVYGGENNDELRVSTRGDATIFGGTGIVDPSDGDDTIVFNSIEDGGGDEFLVYANGGDDVLRERLDDGDTATVVPGGGADTITFFEAGAVTIVYASPNDSTFIAGPESGFDVIQGFDDSGDDLIDISAVVAGTVAFDLAETAFVGTLTDAVNDVANNDDNLGNTRVTSFNQGGHTYVLIDNSTADTFQVGVDLLIRFDGGEDLEQPGDFDITP